MRPLPAASARCCRCPSFLLLVYWLRGGEFLTAALPYLAGGALGGIAAGLLLRRLSAVWLHRALGALIVWGGLRLLLR